MNNQAPISEGPRSQDDGARWSKSWSEWFVAVWSGLSGWKRTFCKTVTYDFGSISANSTLASTAVTITGVRPTVGTVIGDGVQVTPMTHTSGVIYTGMVTANDAVTIYANNITIGAINPVSTAFRIIVFQN